MIQPPRERANQAHNLLPPDFDPAYVEGAVKPFILSATYDGPVPALPMIDLAFGKDQAIPPHIWGMLYDEWAPETEAQGLSVFIQGYGHRGADNARKRIYYTALTPDLYQPMYAGKIRRLFDALFDGRNQSRPLMHEFYRLYPDMYWDLHLGVRGDAVPEDVRQFGRSFTAVIGYWFPTQPIVYRNYMQVRELRRPLKDWVDARVQDILDGKLAEPEKTFVHYWLANGEQGENFRRKDIVFECFHNFLAFSQWGNAFYNIMARLSTDGGDAAIRSWFERTMDNRPDEADGSPFTPARPLRDGADAGDFPERRQLFQPGDAAGVPGLGLCRHPAPASRCQPRPAALARPRLIQPGPLQVRPDQRAERCGPVRRHGLRGLPLQPDRLPVPGRSPGGNDQQRLRRGLSRGGRRGASGVRPRRLRPVRLRLPALRRGVPDGVCDQGFPAESLDRSDRLPPPAG